MFKMLPYGTRKGKYDEIKLFHGRRGRHLCWKRLEVFVCVRMVSAEASAQEMTALHHSIKKSTKRKVVGLYRNQGIFHVPGLHPAALTQLQSAGVCLQGQRCCPPRRRVGGAAPVHPGALRKAGIHHQRLPHRCPQRCRGRQQVQPAPSGPGGGSPRRGCAGGCRRRLRRDPAALPGGIGRYPKDAAHPKRSTGWVHIDTRAGKSRWKM